MLHLGATTKGPLFRRIDSLFRGLHVIGVPGSGKTTLLASLAISAAPEVGMLVIDPEGGLCEQVLEFAPPERARDILYWDPARQTDRPWAGNLWRSAESEDLTRTLDWFKEAIRLSSPGAEWGVNIDQACAAALYALAPAGGTICDIPRFFRDRAFRLQFYEGLRARNSFSYEWLASFDEAASTRKLAKLSADQEMMAGSLIRRVERLITNPTLARIFGQRGLAFDLRQVMAEGKILLVRLNDADLGPGARQVLSNLLIGQLYRESLDRGPEDPAFLVVIDEVNTLIHPGWGTLIERSRQHRVALVLAHQHFGRVEDSVRSTLLVIPNRIAFQLSGSDVKHVAASFPDAEVGQALRSLPRYRAIARLDNDLDRGYWTGEIDVSPSEGQRHGARSEIVKRSAGLGTPREQVDRELSQRDRTQFLVRETVEEVEPTAWA